MKQFFTSIEEAVYTLYYEFFNKPENWEKYKELERRTTELFKNEERLTDLRRVCGDLWSDNEKAFRDVLTVKHLDSPADLRELTLHELTRLYAQVYTIDTTIDLLRKNEMLYHAKKFTELLAKEKESEPKVATIKIIRSTTAS